MSQTNWIAAFLVLGFVVYVVTRGQVPEYRKVIGI